MAGTVEAASCVDARLGTVVPPRFTLVNVLALATVWVEHITLGTRTGEAADSVTTFKVARLRVELAFVHVDALAA